MCCLCVWTVKGTDPSLALLSLDKRTCWGPVSLWDLLCFQWLTFVAAGSRHRARIDDEGGVVCSGESVCSVSISAVLLCWLWPLAGCAPTHSLSLLSRKWEWAWSWAGSLVFLHKPWFCNSRFRNPNATRPCMAVLVASLTLKSVSLFKVLNESRVDLERQTLLDVFSYIPVIVWVPGI